MDISPINPIEASAAVNFAPAYQGAANEFGKNIGLVYNPFTKTFDANPNFLNPVQAQALQTAQLEYRKESDPAFAAGLANQGLEASIITPGSEENFRDPQTGAIPQPGTTYGGLAQGGYSNIPQGNNQAATSLYSQAKLILDAQKEYLKANPNLVEGNVNKILAKLGMGPGVSYANTLSALGAAGVGLPDLGTSPTEANKIFSQKLIQIAMQETGFNGQPQPNPMVPQDSQPQQQVPQSPPQPNINPAALNPLSPTSSNPYDTTQNQVANPAQLGANAHTSVFGGQ